MIRKLRKWVQDFEKCEYFGYWGVERRFEADVDSDNEEDEFNLINTMKKKLSYIRKQKTIVK